MPAVPAPLEHPEVAFALLAVAILGVLLEAATPGVGLGALLGAALAGLALWTLTALDARAGGALLAALAAALLVAGLFTRPRLLQPLGMLAFLGAGLTLFPPGQGVRPPALAGTAALLGLATAVLGRVVARTRGAPAFRGQAGTLVGERGEVRQGGAAGERVRVLVAGALWTARAGRPLTRGDEIVVTGREDLELRVAPAGTSPAERGLDGQA